MPASVKLPKSRTARPVRKRVRHSAGQTERISGTESLPRERHAFTPLAANSSRTAGRVRARPQ